jgi:hypothetical protein
MPINLGICACRSAAVMILAWAFAAFAATALAADEPAAGKARTPVLCVGCGVIYNIRRLDKPIAPERKTLPSITSSPQVGGMGSDTQAVPLFTFGKSGAHRVERQPTTRSEWEITVRYENGQFGFLTRDSEPEFKVGDRVRVVENMIELRGEPAR